MDSIQSIAFQTRVWNKTKKPVFAILLRVEHVWSSIPNQHMRQPFSEDQGVGLDDLPQSRTQCYS